MNTARLAAVLAAALSAPAAGPAAPPNAGERPVDTSFLKQYSETRGFMLGRPQKPKPSFDGKAVLFLRSDPTTPQLKLYEFDAATLQTRELLSPETLLKGAGENLSPEEKARRERQRVSVGGFADFHVNPRDGRVLVALSGRLFAFDCVSKQATELTTGPGGAIDPKWSPDGRIVSYVRGFDLYVYDPATGVETPVTAGGTAAKTHGLAEFVAQEEMGRFTGYWWMPDGKAIAYEEADHAGVEVWSVADPFRPEVRPQEQYYPRPGRKNVAVRLGIVPLTDAGKVAGPPVWVEWDRAKYEYLAAVRWESYYPLTIQVQDRKQRALALLKVDPKTGKTTALLEEKDPAWVNLSHGMPHHSGAMGGFFWMGRDTDGNPEIQLRDDNGKLADVMVPAKLFPGELADVFSSRFETNLIYTASADPTQRRVYRRREPSRLVNPGSENDDELSRGEGVHTPGTAPGFPLTIASTTLAKMPETWVYNADCRRIGGLASVAVEPPFVPNVTVQKAGDCWTAVVRPRDFDPKKKYPVIVDVYGGPKHQHVQRAMRNWLVPQWLADRGFVVAAIENRGTPGRGREWERAVYGKFGTVPLEDQARALLALCDAFPEMDRERVGAVGWSFGGYVAANAVLRRPDLFKAAVAGAPVTDWEDYDTHYTERYLGLLPEGRKAYDEASLIPLAKDLSRPLLLVHGTADDNVYYRHTLKLSDALFRAGKDFEVLPLPGVTHMYAADPTVTERLWSKAATFFLRHLGEPK